MHRLLRASAAPLSRLTRRGLSSSTFGGKTDLPLASLEDNRYLKAARVERVQEAKDIESVLRGALGEGLLLTPKPTDSPVAMFYDLDMLDWQLATLKKAFGPTVTHRVAIKSNSITGLLQLMYQGHGVGIECASMGEVSQALYCGLPESHIVYDSPCKTREELEHVLMRRIHTNLDNMDDLTRAADVVERRGSEGLGVVGLRVNPLVGAGTIAALSVSTSDSKFGTPISERAQLLAAYNNHPWLNCVHVHVGSGGMGVEVLKKGVEVIVEFAKEVNKQRPGQITHIDIGGGAPVNYRSDSVCSEAVPDYQEYADGLRTVTPELFTGEFQVVTEFGQSVNAKLGFLASKVEWVKGTEAKPIIIGHIGADLCPRQVYDNASHERRVEVYRSDGSKFPPAACEQTGFQYGAYNGSQLLAPGGEAGDGLPFSYSVGGPLCFQGDFLAKKVRLPAGVAADDWLVMKDAGANTLSLFSRHCSRFAPPVYGYRWGAAGEVSFTLIRPRETEEQLHAHWGPRLG